MAVTVVSPPQPVTARGLAFLAWELVITNGRSADVQLQTLDVIADGTAFLSYDLPTLQPILANVPDRGTATTGKEVVHPGELAILYLWTSVRDIPPQQFTHRLRFTAGGISETLTVPPVKIRLDSPPTLSAPLAGSSWYAANGPSNDSVHRRALTYIGGRYQLAQRYAIDWVKLDNTGSTHSGNGTQNSSYYAYNQQAFAVADALVVSTNDGLADNVPGQFPPFSLDTAAGNYVILDLGDGHFALYAHLQPGSIRVKNGARVVRGEVLGRVGNSGNSTEPHLHFHVCDANSPLACDGLPWVFDHFLAMDGGHLNEIPLKDDLVTFQ